MMGEDKPKISRRDLLRLSWLRGAARRSQERRSQGGESTQPPRSSRSLRVGGIDELQGLPIGTMLESFLGEGQFYLVRLPQGLLALSARCPQDDCLIAWRAGDPSEDDIAEVGRFYCACDASIFDRRGLPVAGPAPRPLDYLSLSVIDDAAWVDTKTIFPRETMDPALQTLPLD